MKINSSMMLHTRSEPLICWRRQGLHNLQREGCGQRVGDDLRPTVVTDEDRRAALLVAWSEVQGSERAKDEQHKAVEARCLRTSTFAMLEVGKKLGYCKKKKHRDDNRTSKLESSRLHRHKHKPVETTCFSREIGTSCGTFKMEQ